MTPGADRGAAAALARLLTLADPRHAARDLVPRRRRGGSTPGFPASHHSPGRSPRIDVLRARPASTPCRPRPASGRRGWPPAWPSAGRPWHRGGDSRSSPGRIADPEAEVERLPRAGSCSATCPARPTCGPRWAPGTSEEELERLGGSYFFVMTMMPNTTAGRHRGQRDRRQHAVGHGLAAGAPAAAQVDRPRRAQDREREGRGDPDAAPPARSTPPRAGRPSRPRRSARIMPRPPRIARALLEPGGRTAAPRRQDQRPTPRPGRPPRCRRPG